MDEHSTDKESTERRPGEERKENRGEENGFSWPALHHRHLHLQVSQQVSFGLHFNYYVSVAGMRDQFMHACEKIKAKGKRVTNF